MRTYTLAEARSLLPELRPILEQVRAAFTRLRALRAAQAVDARGASADGHAVIDIDEATAAPGEADRLQAQLREGVEWLQRRGIELKDPGRGLIDFYHQRDDEIVFLCYELAEDDIGFWHTQAGGFAGRRPL